MKENSAEETYPQLLFDTIAHDPIKRKRHAVSTRSHRAECRHLLPGGTGFATPSQTFDAVVIPDGRVVKECLTRTLFNDWLIGFIGGYLLLANGVTNRDEGSRIFGSLLILAAAGLFLPLFFGPLVYAMKLLLARAAL